MNITPLTKWGRRISHLQARELTSARHHEPPAWGLDADSQSCDTVGDVQGYRTVCEEDNQWVKLHPSEAAMLEGTREAKIVELLMVKNIVHPIEYPSFIITCQ